MRAVNTKTADSPDGEDGHGHAVVPAGVTWESLVLFSGGGWLPPDGIGDLSPKLLAVCLGKKAETVRNYVTEYNLNVRQIGDETYISPAEIRAKVPATEWKGRKKRS